MQYEGQWQLKSVLSNVMDTGPTATLVGSEAHVRLQLELFDKAIELEKLKIKSKELDSCSRTTNGLGVPTIPVTESCAVAPVALDRNVQPDSTNSGCKSKSEQFGDWLRQVCFTLQGYMQMAI